MDLNNSSINVTINNWEKMSPVGNPLSPTMRVVAIVRCIIRLDMIPFK